MARSQLLIDFHVRRIGLQIAYKEAWQLFDDNEQLKNRGYTAAIRHNDEERVVLAGASRKVSNLININGKFVSLSALAPSPRETATEQREETSAGTQSSEITTRVASVSYHKRRFSVHGGVRTLRLASETLLKAAQDMKKERVGDGTSWIVDRKGTPPRASYQTGSSEQLSLRDSANFGSALAARSAAPPHKVTALTLKTVHDGGVGGVEGDGSQEESKEHMLSGPNRRGRRSSQPFITEKTRASIAGKSKNKRTGITKRKGRGRRGRRRSMESVAEDAEARERSNGRVQVRKS